jgi:hypothetical protein
MKKRPKICDYMGPPGGKTPLGVKVPPLSKKELKIGKSLEKRARELLKKYKSVGQQLPPLSAFKKHMPTKPKVESKDRRSWRCMCGFDADFIMKKQYPERRKNIDGYFQCSKCGSDVDIY